MPQSPHDYQNHGRGSIQGDAVQGSQEMKTRIVLALSLLFAVAVLVAFGPSIFQVYQGGTGLNAVAAHQVYVGTAANVFTAKTITNCLDTSGQHLNYTQSTDSFSCGTTDANAGTVTSIATTSPITGGTITGTGTIACATCVTASSPGAGIAHFAGSTQAVTSSAVVGSDMTNNTVTSTQLAVVQTRRVCSLNVGADNGTALVDADIGPQGRQCFIPYAATVVEIDVAADAGTPNVIVRKNTAGTQSDLLSSALATASSGGIACSKTSAVTGLDGATTCSATLQNTGISIGAWLELKSGTAGGTAKRMSVAVIYTVD